jgi:hypothetical protein
MRTKNRLQTSVLLLQLLLPVFALLFVVSSIYAQAPTLLKHREAGALQMAHNRRASHRRTPLVSPVSQ